MSRLKYGTRKKSQFICLECEMVNGCGEGIQRRKQRQLYHIKDIYCLNCGKTTKNIEIRYCDYIEEIRNMLPEIKEKILVCQR